MKIYKLTIELKSPCLIGSGEGFGAIIDSDIVFDEYGIPYIPSKRIKGCLRDSAIEICEMFESAGINVLDLQKDKTENKYSIVTSIFGKPGNDKSAPVYFSNLTIQGYDDIKKWLAYLMNQYSGLISREGIIEQYTEIRQQTAIDETTGTAEEHSLRTIRVAKKGLVFEGSIDADIDDVKLLYFAVKNLRRLGTKRNRGFGEVECKLYDGSNEINFINELEVLCKQ
ncbi:RAMP superfamily CRISPR-associated protein [Thermodesulfovibrio sp.]|jgi:CRISPR-associated protein Csx10|uniref:RAMP superfamily CRISPR-associated protein n=1 Tax=Thermodesulfovibrio sp. TaxID=2067987 RepID=UPI003C7C6A4A